MHPGKLKNKNQSLQKCPEQAPFSLETCRPVSAFLGSIGIKAPGCGLPYAFSHRQAVALSVFGAPVSAFYLVHHRCAQMPSGSSLLLVGLSGSPILAPTRKPQSSRSLVKKKTSVAGEILTF